jgi:hypothetical protein
MKHLHKVSVINERALRSMLRGGVEANPGPADAKTDFMNAIWRAWGDFVYQKKNEIRL